MLLPKRFVHISTLYKNIRFVLMFPPLTQIFRVRRILANYIIYYIYIYISKYISTQRNWLVSRKMSENEKFTISISNLPTTPSYTNTKWTGKMLIKEIICSYTFEKEKWKSMTTDQNITRDEIKLSSNLTIQTTPNSSKYIWIKRN